MNGRCQSPRRMAPTPGAITDGGLAPDSEVASSARFGQEMWLALRKTFGEDVPPHLEARVQRLLPANGSESLEPGLRSLSPHQQRERCAASSSSLPVAAAVNGVAKTLSLSGLGAGSPTPPVPGRRKSPLRNNGHANLDGRVPSTRDVFSRLAQDTQARQTRSNAALQEARSQSPVHARTKVLSPSPAFGSSGVRVVATVSSGSGRTSSPLRKASGGGEGSAHERLYREATLHASRRQQLEAAYLAEEEERLRKEAQRALRRTAGGHRGQRVAALSPSMNTSLTSTGGGSTCSGRTAATGTAAPSRPAQRSWSPCREQGPRKQSEGQAQAAASAGAAAAAAVLRGGCRPPRPAGEANGVEHRVAEQEAEAEASCAAGRLEEGELKDGYGSRTPSHPSVHASAEAKAASGEPDAEAAQRDLIAMRKQLGLLLAGADLLRRKVACAEAYDATAAEIPPEVSNGQACPPPAPDAVDEQPAADVAQQPAEEHDAEEAGEVQYFEWDILLDRRGGRRVGVDVDEEADGVLLVKAVPAHQGDEPVTAIGEWNLANPDRAVKPGDRFVSVNGRKEDLIEECRSETILKIEVVREGFTLGRGSSMFEPGLGEQARVPLRTSSKPTESSPEAENAAAAAEAVAADASSGVAGALNTSSSAVAAAVSPRSPETQAPSSPNTSALSVPAGATPQPAATEMPPPGLPWVWPANGRAATSSDGVVQHTPTFCDSRALDSPPGPAVVVTTAGAGAAAPPAIASPGQPAAYVAAPVVSARPMPVPLRVVQQTVLVPH
eukprot:TRINITY_DN7942_c0_g1_i1.p1 TRINITY_DN7942_c0_g1~~TRINITY_DN7942_c0_g1_i1.p1  ORF type:complete len:782 (-),score=166.84 TRINITY_DN7942_c0_g1_i1:147-2492(-)